MDAGYRIHDDQARRRHARPSWRGALFAVATTAALTAFSSPSYGNNHSENKLPSWYLTLSSPHLTRAQALALSAPVTGTASSTAPSAGAPDPARTTAVLARLEASYNANPAGFAAVAPKYAALFKAEAQVLAGNTAVSGLVPTSAAWNYLRFRRSLDPARFDANHPRIGPLLDIDQQIRHQIDNTPQPQVLNPPPPAPSGNSGGGGAPPTNPPGVTPLPPAVPEPASMVLLLTGTLGMGLFLAVKERRRMTIVRDRETEEALAEESTFPGQAATLACP